MTGSRRWLLLAAAAPGAGLVLAALAPTGIWPCTLAGHWAPHLAVLSLPLWCWIGRRAWPGLAIILVAAAALWPWLLIVHGRRAPPPGSAQATAQVANLYYRSKVHARALPVVDADLVALVETLAEDRERLRHDPRWPHQCWISSPKYGGMALLSRWPMRAHEELDDGAPLVDAQIQAPWGGIRVFALHTWSPTSPAHQARNRRQFAELAAAVEHAAGPCLVLGDLNASPADPGMRQLRAAGLLAAADGEPATWPSWFGPCGITIDHVLARGLGVAGAEAIDLAGSDHHSVRVRFGQP